MAENAARDNTEWWKLLGGLMHQLGCENDYVNIKDTLENNKTWHPLF